MAWATAKCGVESPAHSRTNLNYPVENAAANLPANAPESAHYIRQQLPAAGLFAGLDWRIAPEPFPLEPDLDREIESLGRVLLQFYRAVNLLYRKSVEGKQPEWVADWLDQGKPGRFDCTLQRSAAFKNDLPRVIRPDILLTQGWPAHHRT